MADEETTPVETPSQEAETEAPEAQEASPDEERARRQGWRPESEYSGDPSRWVSAEKFLERADNEMPIMRERLRHQDRQLSEMQQAMSQQTEIMARRIKEAKEHQLRAIKNTQAQAVADGDQSRYMQLDQERDRVQNTPVDAPVYRPPPPDEAPDFRHWVSKNQWYQSDSELHSLADSIGEHVARTNPNLKGLDFMEKVAEEVKRSRPEKFQTRQTQTVEGGRQIGSRPSKQKGWNDMPSDVKEVAMKFVKQGVLTKDKYAADYWSGE